LGKDYSGKAEDFFGLGKEKIGLEKDFPGLFFGRNGGAETCLRACLHQAEKRGVPGHK